MDSISLSLLKYVSFSLKFFCKKICKTSQLFVNCKSGKQFLNTRSGDLSKSVEPVIKSVDFLYNNFGEHIITYFCSYLLPVPSQLPKIRIKVCIPYWALKIICSLQEIVQLYCFQRIVYSKISRPIYF